nr:unnamed protein product [Callosobruchus chinensis]
MYLGPGTVYGRR